MWSPKVLVPLLAAWNVAFAQTSENTTYYNPTLPGYRPDPSCCQVDGTFYCVTSTFNNFPGLPVYASKDLINWRHVSNAVHREEHFPEYSELEGTTRGVYAPSIRYNPQNEHFYIINAFMSDSDPYYLFIANSTDPLTPGSWNAPVKFETPDFISFDPDLFFDDDGQAYATTHVFLFAGNVVFPVDVQTGEFGAEVNIWNGTGNVWPEAPHIYKKDDYYWLILAEGGTSFNHQVTIARSRDIYGPYEAFEENPILTNANTTQFFQAVGHADFFQDLEGNWWGMALSIRQNRNGTDDGWADAYPLARETVLFPFTWEENEWPVLTPVRGEMTGPLPPPSRDIPGNGPWLDDGDDYGFEGDELPLHFMFFRFPPADMYEITEGNLIVNPSLYNLTGNEEFNETDRRVSYVGRRQTDTLFTYYVDMEYSPETEGEEAGVTLYGTQYIHVDLGMLYANETVSIRLRYTAVGADNTTTNQAGWETVMPVPEELSGQTVRLQIEAVSPRDYLFSFGSTEEGSQLQAVGTAAAEALSGGDATFVGM
jgi:beta-xylosidase